VAVAFGSTVVGVESQSAASVAAESWGVGADSGAASCAKPMTAKRLQVVKILRKMLIIVYPTPVKEFQLQKISKK
jgi:hypothetical protein